MNRRNFVTYLLGGLAFAGIIKKPQTAEATGEV
jgi:hypothetical protein